MSSVVQKEAIKWFEFHADDIDHSDVDASQKLLDLGNVQKALMDIGLFPTVKNLRQIHNRLMSDRGVSGTSPVRIKIDEPEFIEIVGMLTLAKLSNSQFEGLHSLFLNHAISMTDTETNKDVLALTREELKLLMAEIFWQFLSASVARVHSYKKIDSMIDSNLLRIPWKVKIHLSQALCV